MDDGEGEGEGEPDESIDDESRDWELKKRIAGTRSAQVNGGKQGSHCQTHHLRRPLWKESLSEKLSTRVGDSKGEVGEEDEDETLVEVERVFSESNREAEEEVVSLRCLAELPTRLGNQHGDDVKTEGRKETTKLTRC